MSVFALVLGPELESPELEPLEPELPNDAGVEGAPPPSQLPLAIANLSASQPPGTLVGSPRVTALPTFAADSSYALVTGFSELLASKLQATTSRFALSRGMPPPKPRPACATDPAATIYALPERPCCRADSPRNSR